MSAPSLIATTGFAFEVIGFHYDVRPHCMAVATFSVTY